MAVGFVGGSGDALFRAPVNRINRNALDLRYDGNSHNPTHVSVANKNQMKAEDLSNIIHNPALPGDHTNPWQLMMKKKSGKWERVSSAAGTSPPPAAGSAGANFVALDDEGVDLEYDKTYLGQDTYAF